MCNRKIIHYSVKKYIYIYIYPLHIQLLHLIEKKKTHKCLYILTMNMKIWNRKSNFSFIKAIIFLNY